MKSLFEDAKKSQYIKKNNRVKSIPECAKNWESWSDREGYGILYLSHQGIKECCLLFVADDKKRKV